MNIYERNFVSVISTLSIYEILGQTERRKPVSGVW
jgi:hypothetical protein